MEVPLADLRYRIKDILRALERGEAVRALHQDRALLGTILPTGMSRKTAVTDHHFFGMRRNEPKKPAQIMDELRPATRPSQPRRRSHEV